MASFEFDVPAELLNKFNEMEKQAPKVMKEMVEAGGKVALDAVKLNTPARSGDLRRSMYTTGGHVDSKGTWYDNVHADGYDRKGTPNPLKANVLEGGRKDGKIKAKHFMQKALKSASGSIETAMKRVYEERTGIKSDN